MAFDQITANVIGEIRQMAAQLDQLHADNTRMRNALQQIADMDPEGRRADDLGRAARVAREAQHPRGVKEPANPWKEAVLDQLAVACMDAPQDEPPYKIIGRIIDWHVAVATDPAVNGGFKLVKVDDADGVKGTQPVGCEYPNCGCPIVGLNPQCGKHTGNYKPADGVGGTDGR